MNTTCYVGCTPPSTSIVTHGPVAAAPHIHMAAAPLAFTGADIQGLILLGVFLTTIGMLLFTLSRARQEADAPE